MTFDLISLLSGVAVGALGVAAFLWPKMKRSERDEKTLALTFEALAQESMRKTQDQFLTLATEKLKAAQAESSHDLEKRQTAIATMVEPIGKSLKEMDGKIETLGKAGAGLEAQLKNFADDQRNLRDQTQKLVQVLKNPVERGRWGEMQLQRTFELTGFIENVHYKTQVTAQNDDGGQIKPDFVVSLPNGVHIVIDVKTPLDPYWALMEEENTDAQERNLSTFRQSVRSHIKALSGKNYAQQFNSPEFVVMFLPSESLYSLAVGSDSSLLDDASKANVILASPTTVMGLLRVIMYGWQQQKIAEEAKTISKQASILYSRLSTFGDHIAKLGRNLDAAVGAYNKTIGSVEQMVLPAMRKLKEIQHETKDVPEMVGIEQTSRAVAAPELLPDAEIISLKASNE